MTFPLNSLRLSVLATILMGMLLTSSFSYSQIARRPVYRPGLFLIIKGIGKSGRVEAARKLYKQSCRKMNEPDAMHSINDLMQMAQSSNDLPLECASYDMRADYYSVNRGYNELSTKYYDDAILFARQHNLAVEKGLSLHRKAIYYFIYKQNTSACRYFLLAQDAFKDIGYDKVPDIGEIFSETATFYYSLSDFENARANLRNALRYQSVSSTGRISSLNTIGLTYRNSGHYPPAINYFNNALHIAKLNKDSTWISIALGNIGSVYFLQHDYDKALPLIIADYNGSIKYKQILNAAIALLRWARVSIDTHKYLLASTQIDQVDKLLLNSSENVLSYRVEFYALKSLLSERLGHDKQALVYHKKLELLRDSVSKRDNMAAIERVRLRWETEKSRTALSKLKVDAGLEDFKQNTTIIFLVLLIIISMLLYNRQRLTTLKDKELLASEKLRLDGELKNATLLLHGYTENLTQKNILIEQFKQELERLQVRSENVDGASILNKMMRAHIMTEENWAEFKKLFIKVHPAFFYNLRNRFDHLSGTDIRLLALLKLRLNNREIAGMLGITVDGVKKAKQRLRKKIDLSQDAELDDVVANL